jgi:hypothetical protein
MYVDCRQIDIQGKFASYITIDCSLPYIVEGVDCIEQVSMVIMMPRALGP